MGSNPTPSANGVRRSPRGAVGATPADFPFDRRPGKALPPRWAPRRRSTRAAAPAWRPLRTLARLDGRVGKRGAVAVSGLPPRVRGGAHRAGVGTKRHGLRHRVRRLLGATGPPGAQQRRPRRRRRHADADLRPGPRARCRLGRGRAGPRAAGAGAGRARTGRIRRGGRAGRRPPARPLPAGLRAVPALPGRRLSHGGLDRLPRAHRAGGRTGGAGGAVPGVRPLRGAAGRDHGRSRRALAPDGAGPRLVGATVLRGRLPQAPRLLSRQRVRSVAG